ncbi:MAG: hypothetical protein KatS3mg115_0364 [Candidatus Poribacteria bacterium]|nr:MAG: hypothetical protein KatS3mg115_0364 [Candidatus Poribacteria bacterium]
MPETTRTVEAGGLRFVVEYRTFGGDRGPAIRVFGTVGDQEVQALRFDLFEKAPHYHYDPSGFDGYHRLDRAVVPDLVEWTLAQLRDNLKAMIATAGYPELAKAVDSRAVMEAIPQIREAIEAVSAAAVTG